MWEDDGNRGGGKFVVRIRKGLGARLGPFVVFVVLVIASSFFARRSQWCGRLLYRYWEETLLGVIGGAAFGAQRQSSQCQHKHNEKTIALCLHTPSFLSFCA